MDDADTSAPAAPPENDQGMTPSMLRFPVIGLGASAGGIQALLRFFEKMPPDRDMAFAVILHLSPTHESSAAEILQGATAMKVRQVTGQTPIEPDCVYVIPPNKQLLMDGSHLGIAELEPAPGGHASIDMFFRTLANVHKARAFGIVLSGTGTDGAVGLARIKEEGGVTFAQSPSDAEHDGMPRAAIEAGVVDFILPVDEMPDKLVRLWENARSQTLPPVPEDDSDEAVAAPAPAEPFRAVEDALQDTLALLRKSTGHDFRHYKHGTVIRRIERRMQICAVPDLPTYCDHVKAHPEECAALLQDLLIGVTNFFRDREAFEALENQVMPRLFDGRWPGDRIRIWVTACATGEEAYSLAILMAEQARLRSRSPDFQIFATDIDEHAISVARRGMYPQAIETDVARGRLRNFFTKEDRYYRIKKSLRDKLLFAPHNLLRDSPFSRLDLISCRNLLIYLNREAQGRLLELFHFALNPGGYLFLGNVESADMAEHLFTPVDKKNQIYQARPVLQTARHIPSLPMGSSLHRSIPQSRKPAGQPQFSFAQTYQRAVVQFAPPSVVVDRECNIVYISDNANRFLHYIGGEPSRNLPMLVLPQLRPELRGALYQAIQSRMSVQAPRVRLEREGGHYSVDMVAHPFHDSDADADFVLVVFNEISEPASAEPAVAAEGTKNKVETQLEEDLQRTKAQLRETIERAEVSSEEYKASNEELQAINEELRSATEELETSKEELQSANEELVTLNYELKTKVEEAMKVNDDLNNLIASTDIATIFVDSGMHIKRYTPAATRIFNIIAADIGRSLLDITHRLDYPGLAGDAAATFESLVPVEREVRSNDGRFYITRILPYRTMDDRIGGAVLTFVDITSRHRAEERVKASERRIQLFAESTKDYAIITADREGVITSWNKGAERILGYAEEEALGRKLDTIYTPEDIEAGVPEEERRQAWREGREEDERWHVRKNGSRLFCSGMLTPLESNEFVGYAKILRDITEREHAERRREAQLAREKAEREGAQAENVLKDQFLAVMSHELKQPLNLIHINAEMLMRLPEVRESANASKAAGIIRKTILNQAKIIDDLLDLSRLSTGKLTLDLSDVDLAATVNTICEVAHAEAAAGKLRMEVHGTEKPIMIRADTVRLEQIVWNLVNNAIKFTDAGGSISIDVVREGDWARLDVADTGRGIAPEFLPHVFDIYRQAAPLVTRVRGGLGIGLSLVKQLAHLHGGRAEAFSEGLGKGARFSVWFPLLETTAAEGVEAAPASLSRVAGLRILLVDDQEDAVYALKALLELEGAHVFTATTADAALRLLDEHGLDLIVSDIAMPGVDGYELIRRLRSGARNRDLPAIALTGMGRAPDADNAMRAGFSAHIGKPVSLDAIAERIDRLGIRARRPEEGNASSSGSG